MKNIMFLLILYTFIVETLSKIKKVIKTAYEAWSRGSAVACVLIVRRTGVQDQEQTYYSRLNSLWNISCLSKSTSMMPVTLCYSWCHFQMYFKAQSKGPPTKSSFLQIGQDALYLSIQWKPARVHPPIRKISVYL